MIEGALYLALLAAGARSAPEPASPPAHVRAQGAAREPACLGAALPMLVSKEMPYAEVRVGAARGMFMLDYGANVSSIDLKAMPGVAPVQDSCDPAEPGGQCAFDDFSFIEDLGRVQLLTADFSGLILDTRQAGIVGTDFLSENAYTLRYKERTLSRAGRGEFCSPGALLAAGFAPLSTVGYFSSDVGTLLPLSALNKKYSGPLTVPNVPAVPVRVAGVTARAQIDTGYSDYLVRHSVNINAAFYDRIAAADPAALARWPKNDKKLSTCVPGVQERVEAYRLNRGALEFVSEDGGAARSFRDAVVYVKRTPPAALACGGIGTHTQPAAQLGGSFMADIGTVVFDPFASRVWILK
ncbi:MAG: hypothetical protein WCK76_00755 [Elusimicrobiota bacterium]